MDTLVAAIMALASFKEPRFMAFAYKYSDPYTLESYPIVEANLTLTRNLSISGWGGQGFQYIYPSLSIGAFRLDVNPINPDPYCQTVVLTFTKSL